MSGMCSHCDEEVEASEGEADQDALVYVHRPVEDVAPQERQLQGQGSNSIQNGVGDCLWKGNLVWSNQKGGASYHLAGKDCDGEDKEAVEVCDYISLGGEEGVEVGGEKAAHLVE